MNSCEDDVLSELLIAQLLEEDLRLLGSVQEAERLQFDQVIAVSARATGRIPKFSGAAGVHAAAKDDGDFALEIYTEDARISSDSAYAQRVQTSNVADLQYAQKVAAAEKSVSLAWNQTEMFDFVGKWCSMQNLRGGFRPSMTKVRTRTKSKTQRGVWFPLNQESGLNGWRVVCLEEILSTRSWCVHYVQRSIGPLNKAVKASDLNEKGKGKFESHNAHYALERSIKLEEFDHNHVKGKFKRREDFDEGVDHRYNKRSRLMSGRLWHESPAHSASFKFKILIFFLRRFQN
jgi:hypothetical protein